MIRIHTQLCDDMFCHGELGPDGCVGFDATAPPAQCCRQHSMTTIVAMYASRRAG